MYYRGAQDQQNNNQAQAFEYLNRKFAGRGLALQAKTSASSYGNESMYGMRGTSSAPLTLGEFEQNYRSRSVYAYNAVSKMNAIPKNEPKSTRLSPERPTARAEMKREVPRREAERGNRSLEEKRLVSEQKKGPAPEQRRVRRAIKSREESKTPFATLAKNFRHLPVGAMLTVVICAVSLMFIVGSSVLMNDASTKYAGMQDEIASLARQEDELLIALEVKNDLRVIEDIAVNKLGMVKKDLVTRQYIKLGDEDMIETFEDEENNVGISALLTAIKGKTQ